jgi:hypothetical protein
VSITVLSSTSRDVVHLAIACVLALGAGLVACDRQPAPGTAGATIAATGDSAQSETTGEAAERGWGIEAGPFLVLPTVDGGMTAGSLIRPEATEMTVGDTSGLGAAISDGQVELFARGGRVGTARLRVEAPAAVDSGCTAWPIARLGLDAGAPPWTVAFAAGRVAPIVLDSIEGLPARDSARMAITLARMASALPNDTVATFRGLPFVVLRAWRSVGLDTGFVVATLVRRVNQEDAPKEERLVMVIDQVGAEPRTWMTAWHERASGREEELVVAEPLLAFRSGRSPEIHLLFGRDDGIALGAAVLTRGVSGWRVQWESAVAGCDD